MKELLTTVSISSRLVAAVIICLAYYSLFSFYDRYVDFITTIPVFLISLFVVEGINRIVRGYYKVSETDVSGVHESPDGLQIKSKVKGNDNRLEVSIIVLTFSIILFLTSYVSVFMNFMSGNSVAAAYQSLAGYAFFVFLSYAASLVSLYFILGDKKKFGKFKGSPFYYLTFSVSLGIFSIIFIDSVKLLLGM